MPGLVVSSDSGFAVIRMAGKCRVVMANAVRRSTGKEIAAPCIQHGSQQEACGKFSRESQEPLASVKMRKRAV